jgi:tetrahydromethanopterin S-methyltransferase subunit G
MDIMVDQPENLVLRYLRQIAEVQERHSADLAGIKERLTSLDAKVALLHGDFAGQSVRIDRIELRLERIERRLELTPALPQS